MEQDIFATYKTIKRDPQIWKFCFYGFFKNLKFFEPYLYIYLLGMGYGLVQIGLLFAIREGFVYVFEVPSGIIADYYGKKKELLMCFSFYMVAFLVFFLANSFLWWCLGMCFFGLGEAFRSGTHKAMILTYLEQQGWFSHKGFVYGRTRSYSLLGSAVSALLAIVFVLNLPSLRWIFALSILPYLMDFILIASYPDTLDEKRTTQKTLGHFWHLSKRQLGGIFKNNTLKKLILSASLYDGLFKTLKDYIQPILKVLVLSAGVGSLFSLAAEDSLKIVLGLLYGVFYLFSAVVSKNVHRLSNRYQAILVFETLFVVMGILFLGLATAIYFKWTLITIIIYFILYLMMDARRPVFVDVSSDFMDKGERATVLSLEGQFRALLMIMMAPLFGFVAEAWGMSLLFGILGFFVIIMHFVLKIKLEEANARGES